MQKTIIFSVAALIGTIAISPVHAAASPEVSFLLEGPSQWWMKPMRDRPSIITGEHLDAPGVEVWTWAPPSREEDVTASVPALDRRMPLLPATPPKGAVKVPLIDAEKQVLTVDLQRPGNILWVKTEAGISEAYLYGVPQPFWILDETIRPGESTYLYGFDLAALSSHTMARGARLQLVGKQGSFPAVVTRDHDALITFRVPWETPPGAYELFVHNGNGGEFGWTRAGEIEVTPTAEREEPPTYNVHDYGTDGLGSEIALPAIRKALEAAVEAGGGEVVLPPGIYRIDETLRIPSGVTLRGAGAGVTIIQGVDYSPLDGLRMWHREDLIPASVIVLGSHTALHDVTITGVVSRGEGGHGLVQGLPEEAHFPVSRLENIVITGCEFLSQIEHPVYQLRLYNTALQMGQAWDKDRNTWHLRVRNNVFRGGGVDLGRTTRSVLADNNFFRGSMNATYYESIVVRNILRDAPGRSAFNARSRCHFELNEKHGFWAPPYPMHNWEEVFMAHGSYPKSVGSPTGATTTTLTDEKADWTPGEHAGESIVLITAGRGFGQYRYVEENTSDTLTVAEPWRVQPDETSEYAVGVFFAENTYRSNLIDGWGTFVLWLDQLNNRVSGLHISAGGVQLWGADSDRIGDDGEFLPGRYVPSWYNIFTNMTIEGGGIQIVSNEPEDSPWQGPVMFANYVADSKITAPHQRRIATDRGAELQTHYQGPGPLTNSLSGINITDRRLLASPGSRRRATHTMIVGNYIIDAPYGVEIQDVAGKTFVLNNQFQYVGTPILAEGDNAGVLMASGNIAFTARDGQAMERSELPVSGFQLPEVPPAPTFERPTPRRTPPLEAFRQRMHDFIIHFGADPTTVADRDVTAACRAGLEKLFDILQAYEAKEGHLPRAAMYPGDPMRDPDSLRVILGKDAEPFLICPGASPDPMLQKTGLHYLWNEALSGKSLDEIDNPATDWLLIDMAAASPFLVGRGVAGHHGGVNVLYADGTVLWLEKDQLSESVWEDHETLRAALRDAREESNAPGVR